MGGPEAGRTLSVRGSTTLKACWRPVPSPRTPVRLARFDVDDVSGPDLQNLGGVVGATTGDVAEADGDVEGQNDRLATWRIIGLRGPGRPAAR